MSKTSIYRVDWVVNGRVGGLTHYTSRITPQEIGEVMGAAQQLLADAHDRLHFIIDNRIMEMQQPVSLADMQRFAPFLQDPRLQWIVVIAPEQIAIDVDTLPVEQEGRLSLKNVKSVDDAISHLLSVDSSLQATDFDKIFFDPAT